MTDHKDAVGTDAPFAEGVYVITNCSVTRTVAPVVHVADLPRGLTMAQARTSWQELLRTHTPSTTAQELYRGLSFHQVQRMFDLVGRNQIRIVTGGQGCIGVDDKIVPYDFSANPKEPSNIHQVVTEEPFITPLWWTWINTDMRGTPCPIADLLNDPNTNLVVIALQKFFFKYLHDDLTLTQPEGLKKLRIINASASQGYIPMRFRPSVIFMPHAAVQASIGNRNDMPQRAALRFLEIVIAHDVLRASAAEHQSLVNKEFGVSHSSVPRAHVQRAPHAIPADVLLGAQKEPTQSQAKAAEDAFLSVLPALDGRTAKASLGGDMQQFLSDVGVFIKLLRTHAPNARFTSKELADWLTKYYSSQNLNLPVWAESRQRLAHYLLQARNVLNVERLDIQGTSTAYFGLTRLTTSGQEEEEEEAEGGAED